MGFGRLFKEHGWNSIFLGQGQQSYSDKILEMSPWRFYPFWDVFGSTIVEELVVGDAALVNDLDTPKGIILGQPGLDDNTCILFNKTGWASNVINVDHATAPFLAGFPKNEGTICVWVKMYTPGVWTDGAYRNIFHGVCGAQYLTAFKNFNTPRIVTRRPIGCEITVPDQNTADWFHFTLKYSVLANVVSKYIDGIWVGNAGCGTVPVLPAITNFWSGAWNGNNSHGRAWEQYLVIFDRPLTDPEIVEVATL